MEITLTNDLTEIERLHEAVDSFSREHALDPGIGFHIDLSLEEVFTNIVRHGFGDDRRHDIRIRMEVEKESIHIVITDDGREFNPMLAATPDTDLPAELRQPGGLGIHLVRTMMDRVEYGRRVGQNILQLYKRRNNPRSDANGNR